MVFLIMIRENKKQNMEGKNHAKNELHLDFFSVNGNYNFAFNSNLKRMVKK
jgi:hypothetical protein